MALEANDSTLTTVFDTERESEALVVKGLLDSAGIEAVVTSLDSPQDVFLASAAWWCRSPRNRRRRRCAIIADYRTHPIEDSEFGERSPA